MSVSPDSNDGIRRDLNSAAANPRPAGPGRPPSPVNDLIDELQRAARLNQWHKAARLLAENKPADMFYSAQTADIFARAADAGELEIVKEFYRRAFRLPSAEGHITIERLIRHGGDKSADVAGFLIGAGHADAEPAVLAIVRDGSPAMIEKLKKQGADITARGASLSQAFYAGNIPAMRYLYSQGMSLYKPSVVAGLHGRRDNFRFGGASNEEVTEAYRQLVHEDAQSLAYYCAYVTPAKPTLDDLRTVPEGMKAEDRTIMILLARTGQVEDILFAALKEDKNPIKVEDLLRQDREGVSVLSILAARGEAKKLLDARLWLHNPKGVEEINDALKDIRAGQNFDSKAFSQEVALHRLRKKADSGRWKLGGGPPAKQ